MPDRIDYSEFYDQVHDLVTTKAQGTLFTKCDKNHLIIVAVRDGTIISLRYGPKRGEAAIPLIRAMKTGDMRLDDRAIADSTIELPPTALILEWFKPGAPVKDVPVKPMFDLPAPGANRQRSIARADGAEALCNLLTDFLGPIAPLVCEEKISASGGLDTPQRIEVVIRSLAAEIQNSREAEEFIAQAHSLLRGRPAPPSDASAFDVPSAKSAVCELLANYIGPVAPFICDQKVADLGVAADGGAIKSALAEIAAEIEDPKEADEFLAKAWERLQAFRI